MALKPLGTLLAETRARLAAAGCEQAALDARLLLQRATGLSHTAIASDPQQAVTAEALADFAAMATRRAAREPVSRILGEREFHGRRFKLTAAVLDPRPDTETVVDAALASLPGDARILDLGTGSGAIVITLLAERPDATGLATDLSPSALAVARANAVALGVADRLELVEGSWFGPVVGQFDLIVSNPPYISTAEIAGLPPEVKNFDPLSALAGGPDGLDAYRAIAAEAGAFVTADGRVMVEIGAGQAADVGAVFAVHGFGLDGAFRDLGGHVRCLSFRQS